MYSDFIKIFASLIPFFTALWAVVHAFWRFVRALKPLQQTTINTDRDRYWEVARIAEEMRSDKKKGYLRKLFDTVKKDYTKLPNPIRLVIQSIPFFLTIIFLFLQLTSDSVPTGRTVFSIVINCQTIVLYLLVFFLSPVLEKINSDIKYVADAPKREASNRYKERFISR